MKTLFIIVSFVALSYLAMQTSIAKDFIQNATQGIEFSLNKELVSGHNDKEYEALLEELKSLKSTVENENESYTKRLTALEENIDSLTDELSRQSKNHIVNSRNTVDAPLVEEINLKETVLETRTEKEPNISQTKNVDVTNDQLTHSQTKLNRQQKRIQQQAMLRAVSQRMELAALNSLLN